MTDAPREGLRDPRRWLVGSVAVTGVASWLSVAWASSQDLDYSGYLGVVAIAVTLGSAEVAYLVWRDWAQEQKVSAEVSAASAGLGSLLLLGATIAGVEPPSLVAMASGVGLLGVATAIGLYGVYRAMGKSTPGTATAMVVVLTLAYIASVLWAAVP